MTLSNAATPPRPQATETRACPVKFLGICDDQTTCDCCGKSNLKRTVALAGQAKLTRMVGLVGCNEQILREVATCYSAARHARKSAKRAHAAASEKAATVLGTHVGAWDYATWAQNLVDAQGVLL